VIDVGSQDDGSAPRLLETKGVQGEYLTLSYCWGRAGNFTTSKANYCNLLKELPMTRLAQTLVDAIAVTKALGQRYLWIDAICIIQDSAEDVVQEIAVMDQIYQNSTLTIAAANGDSAQAGLFAHRDLRNWWPVRMSESFKQGLRSNSDFIFRTVKRSRSGFGHLETRGWVMQESVLSRRVLIFGPQRLDWYCLADWASEEQPETTNYSAEYNQPAGIENIGNLDNFRRWLGVHRLREKEVRMDELFHDWTLAVGNYSCRFLSVEKDKLPAIGAAAKAMVYIRSLNYVAGLWKEDIHNGLTWFVEKRDGYDLSKGTRTKEYIAPSWSWASRHAPVKFYHQSSIYGPRIPLVEVQELTAEAASGQTLHFGQLKSGTLRLLGRLREVSAVNRPPADGDYHRNIPSYKRFAFSATIEDPSSAQELGYVAFDEEFRMEKMALFCMPIIVLRSPTPKALLCLGLVRDDARSEGHRRVGLILIHELDYFGDYSSEEFKQSREVLEVF
jgi:hypothetical protein